VNVIAHLDRSAEVVSTRTLEIPMEVTNNNISKKNYCLYISRYTDQCLVELQMHHFYHPNNI
jgi:hypothetical protein